MHFLKIRVIHILIHLSTRVTSAIYTAHIILRQEVNVRGSVKDKVNDKTLNVKYGSFTAEVVMEQVIKNVKRTMRCFRLIYQNPGPNDSNH